MKRIYVSIAFLACTLIAKAQVSYNYLKAADNYYNKGDYSSASSYYEKYLASNAGSQGGDSYDPYAVEQVSKAKTATTSNHVQAVYHLAESYRLLTHYAKAEPYYKEATETGKQALPLAAYHYAGVLKKLGKYQEAETTYQSFLKTYTTNDAYSRFAKQELQSLQFIQAQLNKSDVKLYTVSKPAFNGEGATYAPVWLPDGSLLFTSTRTAAAAKNKQHTNRLYVAAANATAASKIDLPQQEGAHQGVVSISTDGTLLYLTRWTVINGKKTAGIYYSERTGTTWSEPVAFNEAINAPGSNNQQPFISPDGSYLLFASDRTGGQGGYDIYYVPMKGKTPAGAVQNLGTIINSAADEEAPYYHVATGTLVFTSNGGTGMGGFDLYSSKGQPGQWAQPRNMGYPVNSVKDDMYFVSKGDAKNWLSDVLISTDRSSACCLEVLALHKQLPVKTITGQVVDCQTSTPLPGVAVTVTGADNGKTLSQLTTGNDGRYSLTLDNYQPLQIAAHTTKYQPGTLSVTIPADEEVLTINNAAICLQKVPEPPVVVGEIKVMEHVYYALNKAQVLDESKPALDQLVKMLQDNPTVTIEISGHTDNIGTPAYNRKLSQQRANNVVAYLVSNGIAKERLTAAGYGDTLPVAPNKNADGSDNAEGRKLNRRTECKILSK